MLQTAKLSKSQRNFLIFILFWILFWAVPWGKLPTIQENLYLAFLTDMVRLGIALGIFIVPGLLFYLLLREESDPIYDAAGMLPIGFAISVSMIAILGLIGRIAGLSFNLVKILFALIGLIELIWMMLFKPDKVNFKDHLREALNNIVRNAPLLFALIIAILMMINSLLFFIDDTSYLAYSTSWQHASHLGFMNIVHKANTIENVRFWLAMYPMGQALLSDLSGVPGLLLFSNYLELFLVPLAIITLYWFARTLGLSKNAAGFAAVIQVSLYAWMLGEFLPAGMWFYQNMAEDKVTATFLLAPVFFAFVLYFLKTPTKNNLILVVLSGLGLTLTHPVILFYSCVIASGLVLFSWIARLTTWRTVLQMTIIFALVTLPYTALRVSSMPSQIGMEYTAETAGATFEAWRYLNIVNDVFYGTAPGALEFIDIPRDSNGYQVFQLFRVIPIVLALSAGTIAFIKRKKGPLHWYILACVLLVLFATVPYTGWILGYFVSSRVISRASWFSPLGLGSVLIVKTVMDGFKANSAFEKRKIFGRLRRLNGTFIGIVACLAFASPMLVLNITTRASSYFDELNHDKQLAQIGTYIDQNTTDQVTVIALGYTDTQKLPGIAAHTNLISFREAMLYNGHNDFLSIEQIKERIYASNTIRSLDPGTSYEERCRLLKKFNVRFVVAPSDKASYFAAEVKKGGMIAKSVFRTKELILLELD